ncbi:hypothetical protein, partial [uncultured Nostoc sp.]|uniref:hypothetical protein n=1 Tax=uncultured Nostoc sp. TaxID=340711 RepID=UPI0035CA0CF7
MKSYFGNKLEMGMGHGGNTYCNFPSASLLSCAQQTSPEINYALPETLVETRIVMSLHLFRKCPIPN